MSVTIPATIYLPKRMLYSFVMAMIMMTIFNRSFALQKSSAILRSSVAKSQRLLSTVADEPVLNEKASGPLIQWYPGHIAKAERELSEYLKKVDVVIEVRDARIPISTTHPLVPSWVGNKPLIIAIARLDQISNQALADWREYYAANPGHPERPDAKIYFVDGKLGSGVLTLKKQALKAGITINEKRVKRGIQPRSVRAAVIGYPNVGKSALINRLLGRRMAKSRNLPGVTRSLQWVRIGGLEGNQEDHLELLDSPGIIPAQQFDQSSALKLAICNDIGEASYDRVVVAAAMCEAVNRIHKANKNYIKMQHIIDRYAMPFDKMTGEEIVYQYAQTVYRGNLISASDKLLGDFRKGLLKHASLESPADAPKYQRIETTTKTQQSLIINGNNDNNDDHDCGEEQVTESGLIINRDRLMNPAEVGRGTFEGW